jgi:hypothetical protein
MCLHSPTAALAQKPFQQLVRGSKAGESNNAKENKSSEDQNAQSAVL